MDPPTPALTLELSGTPTMHLSHPTFTSGRPPALAITTHETQHATRLRFPGYSAATRRFNLALALQSGALELFDTTAEPACKVAIPTLEEPIEPEELVIPAARPRYYHAATLNPPAPAPSPSSSPSSSTFWPALLVPEHTYEIRWAPSDAIAHVYRAPTPKPSTSPTSPTSAESPLPIAFTPSSIKLTTYAPSANPPRFTLTLTPTSPECHLSGTPPFAFTLRLAYHGPTPLTLCLDKTPLRELHGIEDVGRISYADTGEEVEMPWGIGCWEGPDRFPGEGAFLEMAPGEVHEREFGLEEWKDGHGGELEELQAGREYCVDVGSAVMSVFWRWKFGRKRELLAGSEREKEERWKTSDGDRLVDVGGGFVFKAV